MIIIIQLNPVKIALKDLLKMYYDVTILTVFVVICQNINH